MPPAVDVLRHIEEVCGGDDAALRPRKKRPRAAPPAPAYPDPPAVGVRKSSANIMPRPAPAVRSPFGIRYSLRFSCRLELDSLLP